MLSNGSLSNCQTPFFSSFFILAATDGPFENVDAVAAAAAAVAANGDSAYLNYH